MKRYKSLLQYIKRNFNLISLKGLLSSIKDFVIELFHSKNIFQIIKKRKNGISVLIPTQNEEIMVKLSILSFLEFADEIIVVDNGSIDNTKNIVKNLAKKYKKIKFYDKPEIPDLYQNRQFALKKSRFRWICKFDSDFVAYTDGENNILHLRKLLLNTPRGFLPKLVNLSEIYIDGDFWHVKNIDLYGNKMKFRVFSPLAKRIFEYFPFLIFTRFGRREYGTFQHLMKNVIIKKFFWMHCNIKSDLNYFLRSERSNWREQGNFKKFPTLKSYIMSLIEEKYNTSDFKESCEKFVKEMIYKKEYYIKYDPKKYLPYPKLIREEMQKENQFRITDYF